MFYEYSQNNSGGSFILNDNVGVYVWIEAPSREVAHAIATTKGIYFDGVEKGYDCECCGDRWYVSDYHNGHETVEEFLSEHRASLAKGWGRNWDGNRIGVVHYLDGRREDAWYDEDTLDANEVKELEA